jgi:hypothetical protein
MTEDLSGKNLLINDSTVDRKEITHLGTSPDKGLQRSAIKVLRVFLMSHQPVVLSIICWRIPRLRNGFLSSPNNRNHECTRD